MQKIIQVARCTFSKMIKSPIFETRTPQSILSDESDAETPIQEIKITHDSPYFDLYDKFNRAHSLPELMNILQIERSSLNISNFFIVINTIQKFTYQGQLTKEQRIQLSSDERFKQLIADIIDQLDFFNTELLLGIVKVAYYIENKNNRELATKIKEQCDRKLDEFSNIQIAELFSYYQKFGWNTYQIVAKVKEQLDDSQYTAYAIMQIIRACWLGQQFRGSKYSDLAYKAAKQLETLIPNVSHGGRVSVFYALSMMKLHKTTSHGKLPKILPDLEIYFLENFSKLNHHQMIKIIESYKCLPYKFNDALLNKCKEVILQAKLPQQTQIKAFVGLVDQADHIKISDDQIKQMYDRINQESFEKVSTTILLKYLEQCYINKISGPEIWNLIQELIKRDLSVDRKLELGSLVVRCGYVEQGFELFRVDVDHLACLIKGSHLELQYAYKTEYDARPSAIALVEKLETMEEKNGICQLISTLQCQKDDPYYDYLSRHLSIEDLDQKQQMHMICNLLQWEYLTPNAEKILNNWPMTDALLKSIVSLIPKFSMRAVKQLCTWVLQSIDKNQLSDTFSISQHLEMTIKILTAASSFEIHNTRGTLHLQVRDLVIRLSKVTFKTNEVLEVSVPQISKLWQVYQQLNFKTSLIHNIILNMIMKGQLADHLKIDLGELITETSTQEYHSPNEVFKFLFQTLQIQGSTFAYQIKKCKMLLFLQINEKLTAIRADEVELKVQMNTLKSKILEAQLPQQKENYIEGLLVMMCWDAWRMTTQKESSEVSDFVVNHIQRVQQHLNMLNLRRGLHRIVQSVRQFESKYAFMVKYSAVLNLFLEQCMKTKNQERPSVQVCLEYLEFAKQLKVNNKNVIKFLITEIQSHKLKQTQIVQVCQKLSEMKIYDQEFFDEISKQILEKLRWYSNIELFDILNAFAKIGYLNADLAQQVYNSLKFENQRNTIYSVQHLWTLMLYSRKIDMRDSLLTTLLEDMLTFTKTTTAALKVPLVFRQYMDLYNLFYLSNYINLPLTVPQKELTKQIVKLGEKIVNDHILVNQKLNQSNKEIKEILLELYSEVKNNYILDFQYVDFYVPSKNTVYIVDNSLYVSQNLETYTGFHHMNEMILEGIKLKHKVNVVRINFWNYLQMSLDEKKKLLS